MYPTTLHRPYTPAPLALLRAAEQSLHSLADRLGRFIERWQHRQRTRATFQTLSGLNDSMLRDLGLDRSELSSIAHMPNDASRLRVTWLR